MCAEFGASRSSLLSSRSLADENVLAPGQADPGVGPEHPCALSVTEERSLVRTKHKGSVLVRQTSPSACCLRLKAVKISPTSALPSPSAPLPAKKYSPTTLSRGLTTRPNKCLQNSMPSNNTALCVLAVRQATRDDIRMTCPRPARLRARSMRSASGGRPQRTRTA